MNRRTRRSMFSIRQPRVASIVASHYNPEFIVNAKETGKTQKGIIHNCLTGGNGRKQIDNWVPNWLRFPIQSHTDAPIGTTRMGSEWERVAGLM